MRTTSAPPARPPSLARTLTRWISASPSTAPTERRLMTVSMTTAWEREEWALRAVKAVVRLRSPRCSRCRHWVMLETCPTRQRQRGVA